MNRTDILDLERSNARRRITAPFSLRKSEGPTGGLTFDGYAFTTEQEYPVHGGTFPGWMETMAAGSSRKTLRENADVAFLVNHGGLTLARTKSGTMKLNEDKVGLHTVASMDPRMNAVNDLYVASERGDIDEMSFAFRVTREEWTDDEGAPSTEWDGTHRRITEVNLNKGDVSAVNYGANDNTSGGFRALELAVAELRDGRALNDTQRALLARIALDDDTANERRAPGGDPIVVMAQYVSNLADILTGMRDCMDQLNAEEADENDGTGIGPDGTGSLNAVTLGPGIEVLAAQRALWEQRRTA